jgi:hypothetical protein
MVVKNMENIDTREDKDENRTNRFRQKEAEFRNLVLKYRFKKIQIILTA